MAIEIILCITALIISLIVFTVQRIRIKILEGFLDKGYSNYGQMGEYQLLVFNKDKTGLVFNDSGYKSMKEAMNCVMAEEIKEVISEGKVNITHPRKIFIVKLMAQVGN